MASEAEPPDARPPAFSPAEWAALFPAQPSPQPVFGAPVPPDPAEELRASEPLSFADLRDAAKLSLWLRWGLALHAALEPILARRALALFAVGFCPMLAFIPTAIFNDGRFGSRQLAVGAVALACMLSVSLLLLWRGLLAADPAVRTKGPQDGHPLAQLARWTQLAGLKDGSRLLQHDPDDELCPCSLASCAGSVPVRARYVRLAYNGSIFAISCLLISFLNVYTPAVTFAARTWSTPWSAFLVVFLVALHSSGIFLDVVPFLLPPPPLFQLSRRLRVRAVSLALTELLERHRRAFAEDGSVLVPRCPGTEHYQLLHAHLAAEWQRRIHASLGIDVLFASYASVILAMALDAAGGGCIPLLMLAVFALWSLVLLYTFFIAAGANSEVGRVALAYEAAREQLLVLAAGAPSASAVRASAEGHAAVLGSFAGAKRLRARLFGFAIDYPVIRTVVATFFTVAVALWGVIRGLGVFFTPELAEVTDWERASGCKGREGSAEASRSGSRPTRELPHHTFRCASLTTAVPEVEKATETPEPVHCTAKVPTFVPQLPRRGIDAPEPGAHAGFDGPFEKAEPPATRMPVPRLVPWATALRAIESRIGGGVDTVVVGELVLLGASEVDAGVSDVVEVDEVVTGVSEVILVSELVLDDGPGPQFPGTVSVVHWQYCESAALNVLGSSREQVMSVDGVLYATHALKMTEDGVAWSQGMVVRSVRRTRDPKPMRWMSPQASESMSLPVCAGV
ncbi:hypothetical protein DFJ74DRAFT_758466 [Hyaloraphidium curvatum]|nr:hypothetical protein DFJ74DRAFT_758466 [Hyaloraphidium curvatum]